MNIEQIKNLDLTADINEFFNDVLDSNFMSDYKQAIIEKPNNFKQKSNILILTNKCNIDCEYCYQKNERDIDVNLNKEYLESFFDELIKREPKPIVSTVVLFGGEPLLEPKLFFYILDYIENITRTTGKKFAVSTTSNGIYFINENKALDFFKRVNKFRKYNKFSLEISYDMSGHDRRKYKNGKSTKQDVQDVLKFILSLGEPISIRYTLHKDNYLNFERDLIKLQEFYKNYTFLEKIIVNLYYNELQEFGDINFIENNLRVKTEYMFMKYKTPICHLNCKACMGCNYKVFDGAHYLINNKEFEINDHPEFNLFSESKG